MRLNRIKCGVSINTKILNHHVAIKLTCNQLWTISFTQRQRHHECENRKCRHRKTHKLRRALFLNAHLFKDEQPNNNRHINPEENVMDIS